MFGKLSCDNIEFGWKALKVETSGRSVLNLASEMRVESVRGLHSHATGCGQLAGSEEYGNTRFEFSVRR
jgi:hypothetical protein